jgi:hypothetical protein
VGKRPYLVLLNHECVPLDGEYRIEEIHGQWYVLGYHAAIACESEIAAQVRLKAMWLEHDAHALAAEALEGLPDTYEVVAQRG